MKFRKLKNLKSRVSLENSILRPPLETSSPGPAGASRFRRRGQSGQIAVFTVLIFQVLFVLFALTLNTALVSHDKINLQNSLDLAALYGAQKQAEVLNVLAHINFQMRQNFKLLAWRYRILGSMTYRQGPPPVSGVEFWCPHAIRSPGDPMEKQSKFCSKDPLGAWSEGFGSEPFCKPADLLYPDFCDANYFVCVSSALWYGRGTKIDTRTNHCRHIDTQLQAVVPFPVVPGGPLVPVNVSLLDQTLALGAELRGKCKYEGLFNWLITQMFLGHFRLDQKDRKAMFHEIYKRTVQSDSDLDGNSIRQGVIKTFKKNLNYTNKKNFKEDNLLLTFNSAQGQEFNKFFTPINIYPVLEYIDFGAHKSGSGDASECGDSVRKPHFFPAKVIYGEKGPFDKDPPHAFIPPDQPYPPTDSDFPDSFKQFMNAWSWLFGISTLGEGRISPYPAGSLPPIFYPGDHQWAPLSLGYERTESGFFHYSASVKLKYEEAHPLFFPGLSGNGELELQASSFAKPFGGRIGPKYTKGERDPRIAPIYIEEGNTEVFDKQNPYLLKPNYSRYPGDVWGLIHKEVHATHYLKKNPQFNPPAMPSPWPYDLIYFSRLHGGDPLASHSQRPFLFLRMMELMAVAPDLYDLTYYSPMTQYMEAYFPRICRLFTGSDCPAGEREIPIGSAERGGQSVEIFLRGDFGFPFTARYAQKNKNEFGADSPSSPVSPFYFSLNPIAHLGAFAWLINRTPAPWLVKDGAHFLTDWAPSVQMDRYESYSFPSELFGKCQATAKDSDRAPSGCVTGGRRGYSVKLISCEAAAGLEPPSSVPCS